MLSTCDQTFDMESLFLCVRSPDFLSIELSLSFSNILIAFVDTIRLSSGQLINAYQLDSPTTDRRLQHNLFRFQCEYEFESEWHRWRLRWRPYYQSPIIPTWFSSTLSNIFNWRDAHDITDEFSGWNWMEMEFAFSPCERERETDESFAKYFHFLFLFLLLFTLPYGLRRALSIENNNGIKRMCSSGDCECCYRVYTRMDTRNDAHPIWRKMETKNS